MIKVLPLPEILNSISAMKKTALIALLAITLIGVMGTATYFLKGMGRQVGKIPLQPQPPVSPQPSIDTSDWEIYRNEKYGFELRYPKSEYWEVLSRTAIGYEGVDEIIVMDSAADPRIIILPIKGFIRGEPISIPDTKKINFSGINAIRKDWNEEGYSTISILEPRQNWPLDENRIEVYYKSLSDPESHARKLIDQVLSTFKFIK